MSEWKEVWHVWDGRGNVPNDAVRIRLKSGTLHWLDNIVKVDWSVNGDISDVSAYTLGKKRPPC